MLGIAPSESDTANAALEQRLWAGTDQFRVNPGLKALGVCALLLDFASLRFAEVRFVAQRPRLTAKCNLPVHINHR